MPSQLRGWGQGALCSFFTPVHLSQKHCPKPRSSTPTLITERLLQDVVQAPEAPHVRSGSHLLHSQTGFSPWFPSCHHSAREARDRKVILTSLSLPLFPVTLFLLLIFLSSPILLIQKTSQCELASLIRMMVLAPTQSISPSLPEVINRLYHCSRPFLALL